VWFYSPLLEALEKRGGRKPASRPLLEFALDLRDKLGPNFNAARFLAEEYYRRRFGLNASASEDDKVHAALQSLQA
jgi:hypothetical protein